MITTINAPEVQPLLEAGASLIHVLPDEHFVRQHLPGALNACVYEMAFVSRVRELVPDPDAMIVVYGAGAGSLDSTSAAAKLAQAGYSRIHDFRGGLAEWIAAGHATEGTGAEDTPPQLHGRYIVDTRLSLVRWTGRNLFNHHHGTLRLAAGDLHLDRGTLSSARFTLDMNSIVCEDLVDADSNALLVRHLRDDDFFAIDRFPTAECVLSAADALDGSSPGTPNYRLRGELTLRGTSQPIEFAAVIAALDSDHLTAQAQFEIDRTRFGSQYGSGRLFAFLGKHVVNDHVHLHVKLHARRE